MMEPFVFKMPDIGEGIVEAEVVAWHVEAGQLIHEDSPIADVMTDKATVEITSPVTGTVKTLGCMAGEKITIGADLLVFENQVDDESNQLLAASAAVPSENEMNESSVAEQKVNEKPKIRVPTEASEVLPTKEKSAATASPAIRKLAKEQGIDLAGVSGSGPDGRVLKGDLESKDDHSRSSLEANKVKKHSLEGGVEDNGVEQDVEAIPLYGMRRLIAEKMQASKRNIPHFSYVEEVGVSKIEDLRGQMNSMRREDQHKLSILHFVLKAVVMTVPRWPQCNAHFDDEQNTLLQYKPVHLGVATMTDNGLMVPVVRNAQSQTIWELAAEVARLAGAAREGTLTRSDLTGSTITVTSLGALAGVSTTPVINRPETTIIGPNKMMDKVVMVNGQVVTTSVMNISSSFDHRVVDGYDAANMIQAIKTLIEEPALLFMTD